MRGQGGLGLREENMPYKYYNYGKVGRGARVDLGDKDGNTALALAKR